MIMYIAVAREAGQVETDCSNPITRRLKEAGHRTCVDLHVCSVTSVSRSSLSGRDRSALSTELKQFLVPGVVLVDDLRKVDVPGPRVGMWVRNVVHPGRVMPPYDRTIRVGGRHVFWLRLGSLLLRILRRLLLVGLPVLGDGVRRADMEGG